MALKDQILELRTSGLTYREIADRLGCSKGVISYHCGGLPGNQTISRKNLYVAKGGALDEGLAPEVLKLLRLGVGISTIADAFDLDPSRLRRIRRFLRADLNHETRSAYASVKRRRFHIKAVAIAFKGNCCELCGYSRNLSAMEFHHEDADLKDFTVSQMLSRKWSDIKKELTKCALLCANCHRELHNPEWVL